MTALTKHTVKVLLIDDQRMIGEAVRRMLLPEADIQFKYCQDPRLALATATQFGPTVILQDLVMPGVSGLDLVRDFRALQATREVPLIVLSTQEEPEVKVTAFTLGANDYLVKLPDRLELIARIRYHSSGYISALQRDEAYRALVESQRQLERHSAFIRATFGRYLSDDIVASLLETPEGLELRGEARLVTILMADLRGFTQRSEGLPPDQVVAMLNNFLEEMTDVIFQYEGTIDEFIGDAILVVFGAPVQREADAERAVACAVAMQLAMPTVNRKNREAGLPEVEMGIGLHTGEVVAGNIGSKKRAKYGVVGPTVNLTGRIESCTVGGQILISEATRAAVTAPLRIDGTLSVEAKGVGRTMTLYDVGGIGGMHGLALTQATAALRPLSTEVPVLFSVVEGKRNVMPSVHLCGAIVALAADGTEAAVRTEVDVTALTDLKLYLGSGAPDAPFYGKTQPRQDDGDEGFIIRFTSIPDEVASWLRGLLPPPGSPG